MRLLKMGIWTSIEAIIEVVGINKVSAKDVKSIVQDINTYAPKITGSEGNADIFLDVEKECILDGIGPRYCITISITGSLGDRDKPRVLKEFEGFVNWLNNYDIGHIDQVICCVY